MSNAGMSFAKLKKPVGSLAGYRLVYFPDHPRAHTSKGWKGYVYEHILVAEKAIGRSLTSDEVVHHMDGDRANNQASNLIVLNRSQHIKLHDWLEQTGWPFPTTPKYRLCPVCSQTLQTGQDLYCSKECVHYAKFNTEPASRPNREQLKVDLETLSLVKIGEKYGVSDNAVRKWAIKFKLRT